MTRDEYLKIEIKLDNLPAASKKNAIVKDFMAVCVYTRNLVLENEKLKKEIEDLKAGSDRLPVTHVAIRFNGKVYSLPKPNRHCDLLILIRRETGSPFVDVEFDDEGFLDSAGNYLTRKQAFVNAWVNNQLTSKRAQGQDSFLYSEDLW